MTDFGTLYFVIDVTNGTDAGTIVHSYSSKQYALNRAEQEARANPGKVYDVAGDIVRYILTTPPPPPPLVIRHFQHG